MRFLDDATIIHPDGTKEDVKCIFDNVSLTENVTEGNIAVYDCLLFLPKDTSITHKCRVLGEGKEFEVVGGPNGFKSFLTTNRPSHIEVYLKITSSSEDGPDFTDEEEF